VRALADRFADIEVLYPVHPNPNVREAAVAILSGHPRIRLTQPLDYLDLVTALRHAVLVLTDSGGIQEEAPTFQKPVLVLRDVTERPEAVESGIAATVGTDPEAILEIGSAVLEEQGWRFLRALNERRRAGRRVGVAIAEEISAARAMAAQSVLEAFPNPYGDGKAGERIADIIVHALTGAPRLTEDWPGPS
jgi:UDP-N-acetylglucosamine 2-epimerase (non-hydrolysing)